MKRIEIKKIFDEEFTGQEVKISGWVRSVRNSKKFSFVVLNDGSCQKSLQIIADLGIDGYDLLSEVLTGASLSVTGKIVASQGKGQSVEMQASKIEILGYASAEYPLQKKATSIEFLREKAHLRMRTNLFSAVFRVRDALSQATHRFFSERGFYYINTPIITSIDGEGAGEMFKVTTLDLDKLAQSAPSKVNYDWDYFGKETSLCVTGQLEAECAAMGMGKVYTFGPTFRSENSHTTRHLSEFWMIEPEMAFAELDDVAELAADYLKYMIDYTLKTCAEDLEFLVGRKGSDVSPDHISTLEGVRDKEFKKITYTEAVEILENSSEKFEFPTSWGSELQTEHERFLTDKHFKGPVIVTDYPADFKAFYMKQNDDGKTVRAMDVLLPGIGEVIGGSERETDLDKLTARMDKDNMDKQSYWWYLELRKFGTAPHGGFGLGLERAVMYVTGMKNIRDVIAFPRTPKNCEF